MHTLGGSKLDGRAVEGRWVGFDPDSSGHHIYLPEKRTVSTQRSIKFSMADDDVYLPCTSMLVGERKKVERLGTLEERPAEALKKPVEIGGKTDPLGENFEKVPEGHPKRTRAESAVLKRLCTGEGVVSAKPMEQSQSY